MFWIVITVLIGLFLWYTFVKPLNCFSDRGISQTKPWPIFGDQYKIISQKINFLDWMESIYNMFPGERYAGCFQFTTPTLMIRDPDLIKQITIKDFDHFTDHRQVLNTDADPLLCGNLIALRGQRWKDMRATLSGSFTSSKMKSMFYLMNETAENFVQYFTSKPQELIDVELKDIFTRYTNDIIATTAFGVKVDSITNPENEFYLMGRKITNLTGLAMRLRIFGGMFMPKVVKFLKIKLFTKDVATFFKKVVNDTISHREKEGTVREDLISQLLEARNSINRKEDETGTAAVKDAAVNKFRQLLHLTNDEITSQAVLFFFAGFDTISTAMCFGCYELANNKDLQNKLREEICEAHKLNNGTLTYDSLLQIKYLDMVVSETLRKWPPALATDRIVTKPYIIEPLKPGEKQIHLKKGDLVLLPIIGLHRDSSYFPNPEKFDPERFSEENKGNISPYTYIPFGAGPRICIGSRFALVEIKALLYHLLLNFELEPTDKTVPLKLSTTSLSPAAEGGFWFGLRRLKT